MAILHLAVKENININKKFVCQHRYKELTALCPETKLPDFYEFYLLYQPNEKIVELKSLKEYLTHFRNTEILHEELLNVIMEDFITVVHPIWVLTKLKVNVRGGIYSTIVRKWNAKTGDEKIELFDE